MAKVDRNLVIMGLSGSLGDQLVIQAGRGGQTIIRAKPRPRKAKSTPAQEARIQRFREATAYAKDAATRESIYAEKAAGTVLTAYNVALADWFLPPEILEVDVGGWTGRAGVTVRIRARDDVRVKTVRVMIVNAGGNEVEHGAATQVEGLWWEYVTTVDCSTERAQVVVTAEDLPGHVAQATGGQ